MSKYDSINTAVALTAELRANGLSTAQEDIDRAGAIFQQATAGELAALCIGPEQELKEARQQIERLEGVVAEWELEAGERETEDTRCKELALAVDETRKKLEAEIEAHNQTRRSLEIAKTRAIFAEQSRDELLVKNALAHTPPTLDELRAAVRLLGDASSLVNVLCSTRADGRDFNDALYFTSGVIQNVYDTLAEGFDEGVGTFSNKGADGRTAE